MKKFAFLIVLLFFSMACSDIPSHPTMNESAPISFSHDAMEDQYAPIANVTVAEEEGLVVQTGTKTVSGTDWNVYRVTLSDSGQATVQFDGSASYDPDHTNETDTGIASYEWKVLFDVPYGDDSFDLEGHTFSYSSDNDSINESAGFWSYTFANITVDGSGQSENQIRVELITYDTAGKSSEKFRMYFVVEPHGYGDQEPEFLFDMSLNGAVITSDNITINGSLISGSETGEVYVEVAFSDQDFDATAIHKYDLYVQNLWAKTDALGDGDVFSLILSVENMYSNTSKSQRVYIKTYEGDDKRWPDVLWMDFTLAACQGLVAPDGAIEAGGEFILDENGVCQWEGAWSYDSDSGEWADPESQHQATFSLDLPVEPEVMENDFFFVNGTILSSSHEETYIEVAFENSSFSASPVEKYDLQLIQLYNRSDGLPIQSDFSLGLSVESLRGNITMVYNVHVRASVYDDDLQQILVGEDAFEIVVPYLDTDGDGITDELDAFPSDPNETLDSDDDGVGDNSDVYPNDPSKWEETKDEDSDSNESIPGFEFWLMLFTLILAARFQRKLTF